MSLPNLRYLTLSRLQDGMVVASYCKKGSATAECAQTVSRVLSSGNVKANTQLTVTINEEIGTLHLAAGETDVLAVVTSATYSRPSAFKLLAALRDLVTAHLTAEEVSEVSKEGQLTKKCSPFLKEIFDQYDEVAMEKTDQVILQVEEVKKVMEGNINRVLQNTDCLRDTEDKAEELRSGAEQFQKRSEVLKKILWWRNFKMKMIVGLLVGCVLGYIFVPIIVESQ